MIINADVRRLRYESSSMAVTGLILAALSVLLLSIARSTSDRPTVSVIYSSVALTLYAIANMFLLTLGRNDDLGLARWKFGPWMLLWYSVVFGIATVTWSQPQNGVPAEIAISSVLQALWLVAVGVTAWMVGYCVGGGGLIRRYSTRAIRALQHRYTSDVRSLAAPWLLYAIGFVARLVSTATTGRFGYVGDVSSAVSSANAYDGLLSALSLCAPLAVAAASLQVFREGLGSARITLIMLFLFELVSGAVAGGKQNFVIAVLAVVIPFSAARRRLPKVALVGIILLFLAVVVPFNQAYRNNARQGTITLTPRQAVAAAPLILKQTVTGHSLVSVLPQSVDYLAQRVREIDGVSIIVQRTPAQVRFQSPLELVEDPVADMVPRVIWPGKPVVATGYEFSQEFYELPPTLYSASSDTIIGGLYWYGGWIPVLAGMLLFGAGMRLLDDVIDVRENPHVIYLVILLFPSLVRGEYDWQSIVSAIPGTVVVWLLAIALTFRKWRQA
jgi:hypothetical protein